jgi:DNA-binding NarL/FixJ family response regulator
MRGYVSIFDIARELGVSERTVRRYQRRALDKLQGKPV